MSLNLSLLQGQLSFIAILIKNSYRLLRVFMKSLIIFIFPLYNNTVRYFLVEKLSSLKLNNFPKLPKELMLKSGFEF